MVGEVPPPKPPLLHQKKSKRASGKGITPMTVVKKASDIAMKTTQTLIPSLKPVCEREERYFREIFSNPLLAVNKELHQKNSGGGQQMRKNKQRE